MKTQPLLIVLTAANLSMLLYQFVQPRPGLAATADIPAVLRGHALEIVDERGKVRASLSVLPEDPKVKWNGKPYPETVLLRLITSDGSPHVKLGASNMGAGLVIGGELNPTYVPGVGGRRRKHREAGKQERSRAPDHPIVPIPAVHGSALPEEQAMRTAPNICGGGGTLLR